MKKVCCVPSCGMDIEELLISYDNGSTFVFVCPNHAYFLLTREEIPYHALQTYTSHWNKEHIMCDACNKKADILYTTKKDKNESLSIALCKTDVKRLVTCKLTKTGYLRLREKYGLFHEIHDDFYDSSGNALQPKQ